MLKYTDISTNIQQAKMRYKILCYCWRISTIILSLSISTCYANNIFSYNGFSQTDISVVWTEDFRNFPSKWSGDVNHFSVDQNEVPFRLQQITDSGNGTNSIFKNSTVYYGKWEFSVHLDGFSTSNQNRAKFWVIKSDVAEPDGVFVQIGENGSNKRLRLIHLDHDGNEQTIVVSSSTLPDAVEIVDIVVEHQPGGEWILLYRFDDFDDFQSDSAFYDVKSIKKGNFIGITTEFTRTRVDKFAFEFIQVSKFPLSFERVEIINNENIRLIFSENLSRNFNDGLSISIDNYEGHISTSILKDAIKLNLSVPLDGGNWIFNLDGLTDPDLNIELEPLQIEFSVTDHAKLFDIVINEFMPKPTSGSGYIELLNTSSKHLNLDNWILGIGHSKKTLDYSMPIKPGNIIVMGPDPPLQDPGSNIHYVYLDFVELPKTQGSIWISSDETVLIDSIRYDGKWSDKILDGISLEKINPLYIGNDEQNWLPHHQSNSFGYENEALHAQSFELELLSAVVEQDSIFVRFNYYIQNNTSTSVKVRGSEITNYDWNLWSGNELKIELTANNWVRNEATFLEVDGLILHGDELTQSFVTEIAHPPEKGDLSINEILYHPIKDRYASFSDQSEFVEIKNHRPFKISLKNILIRDGLDKFGKYRSWIPVNSDDWSIPGYDYAVIFADTVSNIENAQLLQFFGIEPDHRWGQVQSSTLGLVTSGREIVLSDINGLALDSVFYAPEMHHPLVRDTKGRSLEKIENLSTTTGTKWSTSAGILGGTPGKMNSNNIPNKETHSDSGLQLQPNPFSPDHDGENDITVISLSLNEPGYLLRISIFDRFGYKIKDLIKDDIIGTSYSTIWDGTDSSGNLLGTGVYIVWINAIHRENKSELKFKKPLVLVRKK